VRVGALGVVFERELAGLGLLLELELAVLRHECGTRTVLSDPGGKRVNDLPDDVLDDDLPPIQVERGVAQLTVKSVHRVVHDGVAEIPLVPLLLVMPEVLHVRRHGLVPLFLVALPPVVVAGRGHGPLLIVMSPYCAANSPPRYGGFSPGSGRRVFSGSPSPFSSSA